MTYPVPSNELERLAVLRDLDLLDTQQDPAFDDLCREAARTFDAPVALITLLDARRQWFKARVGLEICETARDASFCNYVVAQDIVLIVPDAQKDSRFATNPLVVGPPHVRFYAGAPLYYGEGVRLGALCIIDQRPRAADEIDATRLRHLADRVAGEIWVRQATLSARHLGA
ncbi:GAF domain-containing protein [Methylobacterium sp. WL18]|uniref:GAF domain-containing protein n=1 Tax=Methylobacterium sp. WL18 TaxID=2603897 RepID=UPI0011CC28EF|nr:GAF domain-containing protein [Methylobacterium sp. WL18]TXN76087.1 GAF domain-containing protein [Methylobacterium sp. WL18]